MIIEQTQKSIFFNEAARRGITRFELESVPATYLKMLGTPDIGIQQFGLPTAPIYKAVDGEKINVKKISTFFTGLSRDVAVSDESVRAVDNKIRALQEEFWAKSQLLKNRALSLSKAAAAEKKKAGTQSSWSFVDGFTNTNWIDWTRSSVWVDSSEGIVFLPTATSESAINYADLTVEQILYSPSVDSLSSNPEMAIDGLDSTNWRAQFTAAGQIASAVFSLNNITDISSIQIDPTGFGISVIIEADAGKGFQEIAREILYKKTTLSCPTMSVRKLRVTFSSEGSALPKAAGIRSFRIFKSGSVDSATLYSTEIGIPVSFSEIKLDVSGKYPEGSNTRMYYTFDNVSWKEATAGQWLAVRDNEVATYSLRREDVVYENGFYTIPVDNAPASITTGKLLIGVDQVEVSAFRRDYLVNGEAPHTPSLDDFDDQQTRKFSTWLGVGTYNERSSYPNHLYLQPEYNLYTSVLKGAEILPFQFQADNEKYMDMSMVLMAGTVGTRIAQPNHTYKVSFQIYLEDDYVLDSCKAYFYQGIRTRPAKPFRDAGKCYGAYSVYVNKTLVNSSSKPATIYNTMENDSFIDGGSSGQGEAGQSFSMSFNRGWNTIDVLVHTVDPLVFGEDTSFPEGLYPYLQLSLFPSLFDPRLMSEMKITKVCASGERGPISEFDLLWNVPQDPRFWSWSGEGSSVLFNSWNVQPIDGFLRGQGPNYELDYKALPDADVTYSTVRIRLDAFRSQLSKDGPILDEYRVSVK